MLRHAAMETEIHEKLVRITVRYQAGRIEPLEFRWGVREFSVETVNARWTDRATRPYRYFFTVTAASGELFLLLHSEGEAIWYLESVSSA